MDAGNAAAAAPQGSTAAAELVKFIRAEIARRGPVSFAWFMEQALYHPRYGYYSSDRCSIGRGGDYFTNVSVGQIFGRLLAAQFVEIWERLEKIDDFMIVEQGAHHGELARDVLESIRENAPEFFRILRYRLIEPFAALRARQAQTLTEFHGKVDWRESVDELEEFSGIHFSNELIDAFPVHLIKTEGLGAGAESGWTEKCVTVDGDRFAFTNRPIVDVELRDQAKRLPEQAIGYETEMNLEALHWMENLSARLVRGYSISIDYGFSRAEFYAPHRSRGTLQCRAQHRLLDSPFDAVGDSDLTAHVEWTSLAERAEARGLRLAGFADQHHFLTGILSGSLKLAEEGSPKTRRGLQTLLHPEMLGRSFQVLALAREVDSTACLSGLKFARDARAALGL